MPTALHCFLCHCTEVDERSMVTNPVTNLYQQDMPVSYYKHYIFGGVILYNPIFDDEPQRPACHKKSLSRDFSLDL